MYVFCDETKKQCVHERIKPQEVQAKKGNAQLVSCFFVVHTHTTLSQKSWHILINRLHRIMLNMF